MTQDTAEQISNRSRVTEDGCYRPSGSGLGSATYKCVRRVNDDMRKLVVTARRDGNV